MNTELLLPSPGDEDPHDGPARGAADSGAAGARQRRAPHIPSAEECLAALAHLAGLVALGILRPAQANAIRGSYREILQHHGRSHARGSAQAAVSDADLLDLVRTNPALLNLLEPLLTKEQIDLVMRDGEGGNA
jgi:hypothetical protein